MNFKKIEDYKSMKFRSFPNERGESHSKKEQQWYIAYLSSMLHRYTTGDNSELRYNWEYLNTLEKYAKGTQGNQKVKEKLLRKNKKTGKFTGRMKDVFQTLDILPEMIDVIISTNMKADYKPQSVAVDEASIKDKNLEMELMKFVIEQRTQEFLKFMGIKPDVPLTDDEISNFTSADIDVLYQTGGMQLQRELACVSACNTSMLYSSHKEIENLNSFDAITYGICATKTYWDFNENVAKYRYVDIKNLVIPKSKYNDFRDITYAGEIVMMTLGEIASQCPDLKEEQVRELVMSNVAFNSDFIGLNSELEEYVHGRNDIFDEYRIGVLDAQWLATDQEVFLQANTRNGGEIYKKVEKDFRLKPSKEKQGQKIDRKQYVKKYEAKWVIGTDILLHYGQAANTAYKGPNGRRIPKLDYSIVKTGKKSLVDRCRTLVDDINLAIAKLRSAIATLPPAPRMVVYDHALQNIKFGNILQEPMDLFDGFSENGVLVVNGLDRKGNPYSGNGGKAVEFMNSGVAEDIAIFSNEAAQKVNMLRQVLGLPEGLDGTAGQKYQLASTMQLAASASDNALFPTTSLIGPLYEKTFDCCITTWQSMCRQKELKIEEIGLNERVANVFKISKEFSNYEFRIRVVFVPTEAEKEFLLSQITEFTKLYIQSNGQMGCSQAEFLMLYKLIKAGRIDDAMMRIARIEALRNKAAVAVQQAAIESNAQQQQASAKLAEEEKRNTIAFSEGEKRKTVTLDKALEQIGDMYQTILKSQDKENRSISPQAAAPMIQENKMVAANILASDQQPADPQEQGLSTPEPQMI